MKPKKILGWAMMTIPVMVMTISFAGMMDWLVYAMGAGVYMAGSYLVLFGED